MTEVKQIFVMSPHKDVFDSIRNWYREDFHTIYIKKMQDIYNFIQKGIIPGLIIIDTDVEDGVKMISKKFKMLCPYSPVIVMPDRHELENYDKFISRNIADIILTKDDIFIGNRHVLLLAYELFSKSNRAINLNKEIKSLNALVQKLLKQKGPSKSLNKSEIFQGYMQGVFAFSMSNEKLYLQNHLRTTTLLVKLFCESLFLSDEDKTRAITANYFFNYLMSNLPEFLLIVDPENMPKNYRTMFFAQFNKHIDRFRSNGVFTDLYPILSQVWEHYDGTGFPNSLSGKSVNIISQIIQVSNKFHNLTARITGKDIEEIIEKGSKSFDSQELAIKFDNAKKYMIQNSEIVSPEIIHILLDNIKTKHQVAFMVQEESITVMNVFYSDILKVYRYMLENPHESEEAHDDSMPATAVPEKLIPPSDGKIIKPVEKRGPDGSKQTTTIKDQPIIEEFIQKLNVGDVLKEPIRHKSGSIVVKSETKLTEKMLKTLSELVEKHTIKPKVSIANKKYEGE